MSPYDDGMCSPGETQVKPARRSTSFEDSDKADREYYRSLTPDERMAIVAELDARYRREHGSSELRVERVVRIIRLEDDI